MLIFTSHPEVELLHNDVVLEVWVPSEVETDPVAEFIILEGLDLKKTRGYVWISLLGTNNQSHTL